MANPSPERCSTCSSHACPARQRAAGETDADFAGRQRLAGRLCRIRHKFLVLSGKGGVGKSTVAANLAVLLAGSGLRTGLLDVDLHGPSIPRLLRLEGASVDGAEQAWRPVPWGENLRVMSVGFLLRQAGEAVIWKGPMKRGLIRQFLTDVEWGDLDALVTDAPPGTGDEPLAVAQLIPDADGAIVITTPQDLAVADVRKSLTFCNRVGLRVVGLLENMSGFVCPRCGERSDLFGVGGGERLAREAGVAYLGAVPIDPAIVAASDAGTPYLEAFPDSPATLAFRRAMAPVLDLARAR